jgi:hypothetical protein
MSLPGLSRMADEFHRRPGRRVLRHAVRRGEETERGDSAAVVVGFALPATESPLISVAAGLSRITRQCRKS